ncbi:MAG: hypothetical protein KJ574_00215, partial [Nanoarchaeota archaeon]|nr:hypothetical protein [Nanoarchaeota archaeon]
DLFDPGCYSGTDDSEDDTPANETIIPGACSDGIDNDGDGKVDLQDPGCTDATDNSEDSDRVNAINSGHWAVWKVMTDRLTINRIDVMSDSAQPDAAYAGDELFVEVTLENGFDFDLEDMNLVVWIDGLELRKSKKIDLDAGEAQRFSVMFEIPQDAEPGVYDILVQASNDEVRHSKYREFTVLG